MERFWKWLMRTDARGIFGVTLLLFVAVTCWRVWVALQPPPAPPPAPSEAPVKLAPFRPLGVIGLVSNQFAAQALVVPVNPFRPTFETMVRNPESGDLEAIVASAGRTRAGSPTDVGNTFGQQRPDQQTNRNMRPGRSTPRSGAPEAGTPKAGPPPVPQYAFAGMFQRPDGHVAAYLRNTLGGGLFLTAGDEIAGWQVVEATAGGIMLRRPDGATRALAPGDAPVELGGR